MTHPSGQDADVIAVARQIEAVVLARTFAAAIGDYAELRESEVDVLKRQLEAAIETLETLDFARETLK
jgi:ribulose 1,5-bisphosphate carboxylase large subunit-like protein